MSFSTWSTTPSSNASTLGIDIGEGCRAENINNALRQIMADIRAAVVADLDGFLSGANPLPVSHGGTGSATGAALPAGAIFHFAMTTAPTGYLKADGAAVSRSTYADLFTAIGTTFGAGNGSTTFNLPDLRGEFIRGFDNGRGIDGSRAFGSAQTDELKSHTHTIAARSMAGGVAFGSTGGNMGQTTATDATGGSETRPRNIALLACIKY